MQLVGIHRYTKQLDRVRAKVDGSDYGRGELESLRATVDKQTELLTHLIEHLNPSSEQLTEWLADYNETLEKVE